MLADQRGTMSTAVSRKIATCSSRCMLFTKSWGWLASAHGSNRLTAMYAARLQTTAALVKAQELTLRQ